MSRIKITNDGYLQIDTRMNHMNHISIMILPKLSLVQLKNSIQKRMLNDSNNFEDFIRASSFEYLSNTF